MIRIAIIIAIAFILSGAILPSELPAKQPQARSPQELCFTAYQWYEDNGGEWDTPWRRNTLGMVDLRTLPQQGTPGPTPQGRGLFILDTAGLCGASGMPLSPVLDTILTPLESLLLESQLNLPAGSMALLSIEQAIWNIHTIHADPTGQTATKPLRGAIGKPVTLRLGGYGVIHSEPFSGNHINNRIAIFQADYRRNRANAERGSLTLDTVRKWTGAEMLKVYGEMSDARALDLVPTEYRTGDGSDLWKQPETLITDPFNDLNSFTFVNPATNAFNVQVGQLRRGAGDNDATNFPARMRHDTPLSSDDHYAEIVQVNQPPNSAKFFAPIVRFAADGSELYNAFARETGSGVSIRKNIGGTDTQIASDTWSPHWPSTIKLEANGSDLELFVDDISVLTVSDTSITGHVQAGVAGHSARADHGRGDDFEAADLEVAPVATPQRIIIVKEIAPREEISRLDRIIKGMKMLVQADIERFMNIQKILQEHSIKTFIDNTPLTPGEQIAHYELTPSYFNLGRKYGLKDNELARAILRPAFVGGL